MSKSDARNEANFDWERLQAIRWQRATEREAPLLIPGYTEGVAEFRGSALFCMQRTL
ncbi:hypothetical protein SBA3_790009 [Candidatus Sulfopaludibacter sp. SbA3]|nr:hypothetical protein SBA3_790009 [Candidatus Sulfopaludibacter sp. SbA3]